MMGSLAGYAALVTGGGSGIGLAAAKRLAADGASVTICGRSEDRLSAGAAAIEEVAASGAVVQRVGADVTDEEQVRAAAERSTAITGGLNVVVACAGGSQHMGPLVLADVEAFRATVDVNVTGTFLTLKHTAPVMARGGGGSFVAISSIAGPVTHRYLGAYCVGKAGIDMLVRVAADELGASRVRVNAVLPGLVDTEMVAGITMGGPVLDDYLDQMPLRRVGTPDDIANAVRYLAGPESSWVTGQLLGVDGGHALRRGPDYTPFAEPVYGADALRGLLP
ncbi:MAG TPA: SDR family oxidoreductase [Acidimicrobiia bacterium]|jgi:NAD(P)-dependent dehydrogenase (short-subunit alcohol dehydrogenase family)